MNRFVLCVGLLVAGTAGVANAGLLVSFDPSVVLAPNSTGNAIPFYIYSDSSDSVQSIDLTFDLPAGLTFSDPSAALNSIATGLGTGQLFPPTVVPDSSSSTTVGWSFTSAGVLPGADDSILAGVLNLDAGALTSGPISVAFNALTTGPGGPLPSSGTATITAVPEPGSMAVLGVLGGVAAWKRRRAKAKKAAESALAV